MLNPLELAHLLWRAFLRPCDTVIDATCGNGKDSLYLASLLPSGILFCMDIQDEAIARTRTRLIRLPSPPVLHFCQHTHAQMPDKASSQPVRLVVYNLGYLPGGDHGIHTMTETTLQSLSNACSLVAVEGCISIMCYPGHSEGKRESSAVLEWVLALPDQQWNLSHHQWPLRQNAPFLLFLQKK